MKPVHEQIADELNDRRLDLLIKWTEVARRLNTSVQHLLRIRQGISPITEDMAAAIDTFLGRPRGETWRRVGGVQQSPTQPLDAELEPPHEWSVEAREKLRTMSTPEIIDYINRVYRENGEAEARRAIRAVARLFEETGVLPAESESR
jgi:transcriptional regulator with XRE-family HTH domain